MTDELTMTYEIGLIGSILYDGDCFSRIVGIVTDADFKADICADAFRAASDMYADGGVIDPIAVSSKMVSMGRDDLECRMFARDAMMSEGTSGNVEIYANGIKEQSRMRRITDLITGALMEHGEPDALTNAIMDGLYAIERGPKGKAKILKDGLAEFAAGISSNAEEKRVFTGWPRIDRMLGGMGAGNVMILAARPGCGKSAMGSEIALRAAEKGIPSVLISCEMTENEILRRYVSNRAKIALNAIIDKSFRNDTASCERFWTMNSELSKVPLYISDEPYVTVNDIRRTLQTIKGVGLVVIDYLQLMESTGKSENRNLEVAKITRSLKLMAMKYKLPIILLSQLNRAKGEYDEPALSDLRDSGAIEQDADQVMFIWNLDEPEPGVLQRVCVKVSKNRNGLKGTTVMRFNGAHMAFYETDEEYIRVKKSRSRKFTVYGGHDPDLDI